MVRALNATCWCGKNREYQHCHADIDRVPADKKYNASQAVYARNWISTSRRHFMNGVYHWIASQLKDKTAKRILDIGCGSGHGLVALYQVLGSCPEIVAIDENKECLRLAAKTLRGKLGINAHIETRMSVYQKGRGYVHRAQPLTIHLGSPCTLIESDVCNDQHLATALQLTGQFDVVTVWLTGVHMLRQDNVELPTHAIGSEAGHRDYVQRKSYALADIVLRSGGMVQICDRIATSNPDQMKRLLLRHHENLALETSIELESMSHRPYSEPDKRKTPLKQTLLVGSSDQPPGELALISVISRKP